MSNSKDFTIISTLGKGGFGVVQKVINNLDDTFYALKRVKILNGCQNAINEVQILAKLAGHQSFVRYHTSWIENDDENQTITSETSSVLQSLASSLSSLEVTFQGSQSTMTQATISHTSYESGSNDNASDTEKSVATFTLTNSTENTINVRGQTLFIQMELCNLPLDKWILDEAMAKSLTIILHAFFQIAVAVKFLHKNGIVHADLKPPNIFVSKMEKNGRIQIKIGDFGLARMIQTPLTGKVYAGKTRPYIGTSLYAAPEILNPEPHMSYDAKIDVYAMGIILFEMLYTMKTGSERIKVLEVLGENRDFPPKFSDNHKEEAKQIAEMIKHQPEFRPTSKQIQIWIKRYHPTPNPCICHKLK